jgi:flagellar M-ring protein FliF
VNRNAFTEAGKPAPRAEDIDRQVKEIEALITSAAGLKKERGDMLKVTAVDFMFNDSDISPAEGPGFLSMLQSHFGAILNALTAIGVAALVVIFGLMPARRALMAEAVVERLEPPPLLGADAGLSIEGAGATGAEMGIGSGSPSYASSLMGSGGEMGGMLEKDSALRQLEDLIRTDEAKAVEIMKQWLRA